MFIKEHLLPPVSAVLAPGLLMFIQTWVLQRHEHNKIQSSCFLWLLLHTTFLSDVILISTLRSQGLTDILTSQPLQKSRQNFDIIAMHNLKNGDCFTKNIFKATLSIRTLIKETLAVLALGTRGVGKVQPFPNDLFGYDFVWSPKVNCCSQKLVQRPTAVGLRPRLHPSSFLLQFKGHFLFFFFSLWKTKR